jgi:hypothetical protein
MYKVLIDFIDTDGVAYYKGDSYPVFSFLINQDHIDYLLSSENKAGQPVIGVKEKEETEEQLEEGLEEKEDSNNKKNTKKEVKKDAN